MRLFPLGGGTLGFGSLKPAVPNASFFTTAVVTTLLCLDLFLVPLVECRAKPEKPDLYKVLGVDKTASIKEIKKAYRALSAKTHPDKCKDPDANEKFIAISEAYQNLLDPKKREIYDKYGHEGLEREARGGFTDAYDLFRQFGSGGFSFFGGHGFGNFQRKAASTIVPLFVTLEELFDGAELEVEVSKQIMCFKCEGSGAKSKEDIKDCGKCRGQGFIVRLQRLGMGIVQQMQEECPDCHRKGKVIKNVCPHCKGKKVVHGIEEVVIDLPKSAPDSYQIPVENGGDYIPDYAPGDLKFIVNVQPHNYFSRNGNNLYARMILSLDEALNGFSKPIKHLDGNNVVVERNRTTQPGFTLTIPGKGMPIFGSDSYEFGNLYVTFDVILPEKKADDEKGSTKSKDDTSAKSEQRIDL